MPLPAASPPLVHMTGIGKRFGSVTVLDGVDLEVHAGEVLATREKPGESFLGKRILGFGDVYRLMQLENTRH